MAESSYKYGYEGDDINTLAGREDLCKLFPDRLLFKLSDKGYNGNNPDRQFIAGDNGGSLDHRSRGFGLFNKGQSIDFLDLDYLNLPEITWLEGKGYRQAPEPSPKKFHELSNSTCACYTQPFNQFLKWVNEGLYTYSSENDVKKNNNGTLISSSPMIYIELQGAGGNASHTDFLFPCLRCQYDKETKQIKGQTSTSKFYTIKIVNNSQVEVNGDTYYYKYNTYNDPEGNSWNIFRFYNTSDFTTPIALNKFSLWNSTDKANTKITECDRGFSYYTPTVSQYIATGNGGSSGAFINLCLDLSKNPINYIKLEIPENNSASKCTIFTNDTYYSFTASRGNDAPANRFFTNRVPFPQVGIFSGDRQAGPSGGSYYLPFSIIDGNKLKINNTHVGSILTRLHGGGGGAGSAAHYYAYENSKYSGCESIRGSGHEYALGESVGDEIYVSSLGNTINTLTRTNDSPKPTFSGNVDLDSDGKPITITTDLLFGGSSGSSLFGRGTDRESATWGSSGAGRMADSFNPVMGRQARDSSLVYPDDTSDYLQMWDDRYNIKGKPGFIYYSVNKLED